MALSEKDVLSPLARAQLEYKRNHDRPPPAYTPDMDDGDDTVEVISPVEDALERIERDCSVIAQASPEDLIAAGIHATKTPQLHEVVSSLLAFFMSSSEPGAQQADKPKKICTYFLKGTCTKGAKCGFQHPEGEEVTRQANKPKKICTYFLRGTCTKGAQCRFQHPEEGTQRSGGVASAPPPSLPPAVNPASEVQSIIDVAGCTLELAHEAMAKFSTIDERICWVLGQMPPTPSNVPEFGMACAGCKGANIRHVLEACGHAYCVKCLTESCTMQLEGQVPMDQVKCTEQACEGLLHTHELRAAIGRDEHNRYSFLAAQIFADQEKQAYDAAVAEARIKECEICLDELDVSEMYTVDCASTHRFCFDCIRRHCLDKINTGAPPNCPEAGCGHVLGKEELIQLYGRDAQVVAKFESQQLQSSLQNMSDVVPCPAPGCAQWLVVSTPGQVERCNCKCGHSFCSLCRLEYHFNCTCEEVQNVKREWMAWVMHGREVHSVEIDSRTREYQQEKAAYDREKRAIEKRNKELRERFEELQAQEQMMAQAFKCCPSCNRVVEKISGCDAMVCGQDYHGGNIQNGCGASFNWGSAPAFKGTTQGNPTQVNFAKSAPSLAKGVSHGDWMRCDTCHKEIVGMRFNCIQCPCYNLCDMCESRTEHNPTHCFRIVVQRES